MPALRPIIREPQSLMDVEQNKLLRLRAGTRRDDVFSTLPRQPLGGAYAGTQVSSQTQVSGGSVG